MKRKLFFLFLLFYSFRLFAEDGFFYQHIQTPSQSVYLLEVDPTKYDVLPARALDDGIGRETVLSLARRYGAIAAINGGFFAMQGLTEGVPRGILKIDRQWLSLPLKPRAAIGWRKDERPLIDALLATCQVSVSGKNILMDGYNRERKSKEVILYSDRFHRTTLTLPMGMEVLIQQDHVKEIRKGGSSLIPENGWVISIDEEHPLYSSLPFRVGEEVKISFQIFPQFDAITKSEDWEKMEQVVGGTPLLVQKGKIVEDFHREKVLSSFLLQKHPRTAVGILPNQHWLFVVVERKGEEYLGMTMRELALFMQQKGCIDAINLDGGGSSTMVIEGKERNFPGTDEDEEISEGNARKVSDALLILQKKSSGKTF